MLICNSQLGPKEWGRGKSLFACGNMFILVDSRMVYFVRVLEV